MFKLGNLIEEDIYLLDFETLNCNNTWQDNYKFHLIQNEFKSYKIGIPFIQKNNLVDLVNQFIESITEIKGSYFVYFDIERKTKLLTLIEGSQIELNNKKVFLLPEKDLKYSEFSSDFWEMTLMGYEINILKCDRMNECQTTPRIINKYLLKGARIGITGSKKYSFGLLHKKRIKQLHKENLIDYWITQTINQNDSSYFEEIKLKSKILKKRD